MTVDPDADNNAHTYALDLVGRNQRVLEVGCATGYVTKALVDQGCTVVGIELDAGAAAQAETWAEHVVVGDIDLGDVWAKVPDESFDVVLCGDVLEHLRDPLGALKAAVRKLKPTGMAVISLPNVAHGDVRLSLLKGSFDYRELGLLDRTHVRFFTLETTRQLLRDAGLVEVRMRRVIVPLFGSELEVDRAAVGQSTVDEVLTDPEAETYQFVVKAVRDNGVQAVADLSAQVAELSDHIHHEGVRAALLHQDVRDAAVIKEENAVLAGQVADLHRHIAALDGHVNGLNQNIAHLNQALAASEARYQGLLNSRIVKAVAPARRVLGVARRALASGPGGQQ